MSDDSPKTVRFKRGAPKSPVSAGDGGTVRHDRKTKLGQRVGEQAVGSTSARDQERTVAAKFSDAGGSGAESGDGLVVGWLVIEHGVGRGRSFPLYNRRNAIGRATGQDVALTFPEGEDAEISRESHCFIGFEPKKSVFIAEPGAGSNYAYVNGDALLTHVELEAYDRVEVGGTILVFVPFCGGRFQWQASSAE